MLIKFDVWTKKSMELVEKIKANSPKAKFVYGVPRGGTLLSLFISMNSNLKLTDVLLPPDICVVVDDLIDSGRTRNKYKTYSFYVLFDKRELKGNKWIEFWYEDTQNDVEDLIARQLEYIGENPTREGLVDTPKRVVRMWKEIFRGYDINQIPKVTTFNNGCDGIIYDEMIMDQGTFYSQCEHHMVPFFGKYYFAYIPNTKGKLLGLSKVARVVDYYSAKLQIQERLGNEIVNHIWSELCKNIKETEQPIGMGLVLEAEHLCKTMRGVKKKGTMRTTILKGCFKEKPETRQEFLGWISNGVK